MSQNPSKYRVRILMFYSITRKLKGVEVKYNWIRFRLSYYKYKCLHLGSFGVIQRNRMIYEEDESVESSFGTVGSQLGTSNHNLGSDCRYHTYPRIRTLFSHKPYPSPITNTNPRPNPNKNELKVKAAKVSNNL